MRATRQLAWTLACAIGCGAAGSATATNCYVVLDRNDVVIFRDVVPPWDISDMKALDPAAMRARGEHLMIADFDKCEPAGYISATTGGTTASVDDIVTQLKPAIAPSVGTRQGATAAKAAAAAPAASAPARAAPARPAAKY